MSERKYANYLRKSVYGPGGLYTVARARDRTDLFSISDSVTLSISILNELNLYPVFWVTLRIPLYCILLQHRYHDQSDEVHAYNSSLVE